MLHNSVGYTPEDVPWPLNYVFIMLDGNADLNAGELRIELRILGPFCLRVAGETIPVPGKIKKALISMIALAPDCKISRDQLTTTLWSQRSPEQASGCLRQALAELRRLFKTSAPDLLSVSERGILKLNIAPDNIDCLRLKQVSRSHSIIDKKTAIEFYQGELLAGINLRDPAFEDYVQIERVHYRSIYQDLLRNIISYQTDCGDYLASRAIAERLLAVDRADEFAHRSLMSVYNLAGDKANALRQYSECRQYLHKEFGAYPGRETEELHAQIQSGKSLQVVTGAELSNTTKKLGVGLALFEFLPGETSVQGITLDFCSSLASAITQFRWLSVHPTRSTFSYAAKGIDASEMGRRLGLAYAIDGRLLCHDKQIRLTVELVDVESQSSIWAERFTTDESIDSLLGTEILGAIVSRIDVRIRVNEINKIVRKNTANTDAFSCVLNAVYEMHQMTPAAYESARRLLDKAEELDPLYSDIFSWRAFCQIFFVGQGYGSDNAREVKLAAEYAQRAITLNPEDALALAICGHSESFLNQDLQTACHYFERSLKLNPHSSFAWMLSSATYSYLGDHEEALRRINHSELLCPIEPHYELLYNMARTLMSYVAEDYLSVVEWGEKTIRENATFSNGYKLLIAALGHLGQVDKSNKYINRLLELEPDFNLRVYVTRYPLARLSDKKRLMDDLLKAGLSDTNAVKAPQGSDKLRRKIPLQT